MVRPVVERDVSDLVEAINSARSRDEALSLVLLVGAGCSASAGIPTAPGFVSIIKREYKQAYERARNQTPPSSLAEPTYQSCMAELEPGARRALLAREIEKAKLNWAHVAIACLMAEGVVTRVLTTNFDPLVLRACAMLNVCPPVYDLAASKFYDPENTSDPCVLYLHGQHSGYLLVHTNEEFRRHAKKTVPEALRDSSHGRIWVVVGYGGANDPVFDHLAATRGFENGLYWIAFEKEDPAPHVTNRLLRTGKHAFLIRGYNADTFFIAVAQQLGCFPPRFVADPFLHLQSELDSLTPYPISHGAGETDPVLRVKALIRSAREGLASSGTQDPVDLLMKGRYTELVDRLDQPPPVGPAATALQEAGAWALVSLGNLAANEAEETDGAEADRLFAEACERYGRAAAIKADMHDAWYNWGNALLCQARQKEGPEADRLFTEAYEKYGRAVTIKADMHEAWYNWGVGLLCQAKRKEGPEADRLFAEAYEKYGRAVAIKPDKYEAWCNWGNGLLYQAKQRDGEERSSLLGKAKEILLEAEKLRPGSASYDLACVVTLVGDSTAARGWLLTSQRTGTLPGCEHLRSDSDLNSLRAEPWFETLLHEICETH